MNKQNETFIDYEKIAFGITNSPVKEIRVVRAIDQARQKLKEAEAKIFSENAYLTMIEGNYYIAITPPQVLQEEIGIGYYKRGDIRIPTASKEITPEVREYRDRMVLKVRRQFLKLLEAVYEEMATAPVKEENSVVQFVKENTAPYSTQADNSFLAKAKTRLDAELAALKADYEMKCRAAAAKYESAVKLAQKYDYDELELIREVLVG